MASCMVLCRQLDSPSEMTTATVVKRILANRQVRLPVKPAADMLRV